MRRDSRLLSYSREHHAALRLARMLTLGEAAEAASAAVDAMRGELARHFEEEERQLIPQLETCGESTLTERLLAEHVALRSLLLKIGDGKADLVSLRRLGQLLEAHVRFEERELFAALQRHWVTTSA